MLCTCDGTGSCEYCEGMAEIEAARNSYFVPRESVIKLARIANRMSRSHIYKSKFSAYWDMAFGATLYRMGISYGERS